MAALTASTAPVLRITFALQSTQRRRHSQLVHQISGGMAGLGSLACSRFRRVISANQISDTQTHWNLSISVREFPASFMSILLQTPLVRFPSSQKYKGDRYTFAAEVNQGLTSTSQVSLYRAGQTCYSGEFILMEGAEWARKFLVEKSNKQGPIYHDKWASGKDIAGELA